MANSWSATRKNCAMTRVKKSEPRPVAGGVKKTKPRPVASKAKKLEQHPFTLRAIYLREGKQWISDDFDPLLPGQQLSGQMRLANHKIQIQEAIENIPDSKPIKSCRITIDFGFRYLNATPESPPESKEDKNSSEGMVAEISARITVDYLLGASEVPAKEKLEQWAKSNSLLHCWPYWREFCHSALSRMNLPITMMPMLDLTKK